MRALGEIVVFENTIDLQRNYECITRWSQSLRGGR